MPVLIGCVLLLGNVIARQQAQRLELLSQEFAFGPGLQVKDAAFCAEEVTETTHAKRVRGSYCRDGEGRTRLERRGSTVIVDPVADVSYLLRGNRHQALRGDAQGPLQALDRDRVQSNRKSGGTFRKESLGVRTIEGLPAQGIRSTESIGQDEVVTETWFSPDLQVVILTRYRDSRVGESVHRLMKIRVGEPDARLFRLPPGYRVVSQ
jgi:hypothetical protein